MPEEDDGQQRVPRESHVFPRERLQDNSYRAPLSRRPLVHTQVPGNPLRRFAPLENRCHDEVRTAHHVAAGKHLWVGCLERMLAERCDAHAAAWQHVDAVGFEPVGRIGSEAEGDDDGISRQDFLGTGYGLRAAASVRARLAELRLDDLDALDLVGADDLERLPLNRKLTPSSLLFATSRREPGMFSSSRR